MILGLKILRLSLVKKMGVQVIFRSKRQRMKKWEKEEEKRWYCRRKRFWIRKMIQLKSTSNVNHWLGMKLRVRFRVSNRRWLRVILLRYRSPSMEESEIRRMRKGRRGKKRRRKRPAIRKRMMKLRRRTTWKFLYCLSRMWKQKKSVSSWKIVLKLWIKRNFRMSKVSQNQKLWKRWRKKSLK